MFRIFIRFLCIFVYTHVQYYIITEHCTLLCFLCKMYINVKFVLKNVFSLCGIFFRRIFAALKGVSGLKGSALTAKSYIYNSRVGMFHTYISGNVSSQSLNK